MGFGINDVFDLLVKRFGTDLRATLGRDNQWMIVMLGENGLAYTPFRGVEQIRVNTDGMDRVKVRGFVLGDHPLEKCAFTVSNEAEAVEFLLNKLEHIRTMRALRE